VRGPRPKGWWRQWTSNANVDANYPQTAATYLEHAEQMDPGNYITHYLLGQAYKELGRAEDAKHEIDAVSKIQSESHLKFQSVQ
jgi:predicted Zn-dependent protease